MATVINIRAEIYCSAEATTPTGILRKIRPIQWAFERFMQWQDQPMAIARQNVTVVHLIFIKNQRRQRAHF